MEVSAKTGLDHISSCSRFNMAPKFTIGMHWSYDVGICNNMDNSPGFQAIPWEQDHFMRHTLEFLPSCWLSSLQFTYFRRSAGL